MRVRPSDEGTYEHFWHKAGNGEDLLIRFRANKANSERERGVMKYSDVAGGMMGLTDAEARLASAMSDTELMERAIGVVSSNNIKGVERKERRG